MLQGSRFEAKPKVLLISSRAGKMQRETGRAGTFLGVRIVTWGACWRGGILPSRDSPSNTMLKPFANLGRAF